MVPSRIIAVELSESVVMERAVVNYASDKRKNAVSLKPLSSLLFLLLLLLLLLYCEYGLLTFLFNSYVQLLDGPSVIALRYPEYRRASVFLKDYFNNTLHNFYSLDATWSKWRLYASVLSILHSSIKQRQQLLACELSGDPLPIDGLCISAAVVIKHLSPYGQYCPVS